MAVILEKLKEFTIRQDMETSANIFKMKKSSTLDYSLSFPANAFTFFGYPFVCLVSCVMFPLCEKEVMEYRRNKDGNDEDPDPKNLLNTDFIFTFVWYTFNVVICFGICRVLKSFIGR